MKIKYYDLSTMEMLDRKTLFESEPENYVYSAMHEIVDKSYDLVDSHRDVTSSSFHEVLPYEVLTQLLSFMSGIYDVDNIFEQIETIEQIIRENVSLRTMQ